VIVSRLPNPRLPNTRRIMRDPEALRTAVTELAQSKGSFKPSPEGSPLIARLAGPLDTMKALVRA